MKPLRLFKNFYEISLFFSLILVIFCCNLAFEFRNFKDFKSQEVRYIDAKILKSYEKNGKNGKNYQVLKLKSENFEFYTTLKKPKNFAVNSFVNVGILSKNINFKEFLIKKFYAPNVKISPINREFYAKNNILALKDKMINFITSQHESEKMKEFYSTLYFATEISKELRENVTNWGIAHIVSISGFHIGIIFGVIFLCVSPIYFWFQSRYFPWRDRKIDITNAVLLFLLIYLVILELTPSFLRSVGMCILGYFLLLRNIKILNFTTLFLTILLLVAIFPSLLFSIGFYFSSLGVLFIFIYLHHFSRYFGLFGNIFWLNIFVFLAMNIPVYFFFPTITIQQISVMPLGYVFVVFYPLSVVLHIINLGGILDVPLLNFLNFALPNYQTQIPFWLFLFANFCAVLGVRFKIFAFFAAVLGILPIFFI